MRIPLLTTTFALVSVVLAVGQQIPPADGALVAGRAGKKAAERFSRRGLPSQIARLSDPEPAVLPELDAARFREPNEYGQAPIGTTRTLERDATEQGAWETTPDGRSIWRVSVRSPGAAALRVRFSSFGVGRGRVWVYPAGDGPAEAEGPYSGAGLYENGEFWSGAVASDTLVVEYEPEEQPSEMESPPFRIPELAHFWQEPANQPSSLQPQAAACPKSAVVSLSGSDRPAAAAPCHPDYKCHSAWSDTGKTVALIVFRKDSDRNFYACGGTVLITRDRSFIPYFLTSNHCIGTDSEAQSVLAFWSYDTSSCGGWCPELSGATRTEGARLLVTRGLADGGFSLLRLNGAPDGTWFAGWDPNEHPQGAAVTIIHHPAASCKRIAFGYRGPDQTVIVGGEPLPADKYYQVQLTQGRVEGGSSGAPLFNEDRRFVGLHTAGPRPSPPRTVCDISDFRTANGRFSVMYDALRDIIDPPRPSCSDTPIRPGRVNGALSTNDCRSRLRGSNNHYADRYSFTGTAGDRVSIELTSGNFDTYLYLVGPNGSLVTENDDGGAGTDSRIPPDSGYYTLPATGTYVIEATSYEAGRTGAYALTLTVQAQGCQIRPIVPGSVTGALTTDDCRSPLRGSNYYADRYSFTGTAGDRVSIELSSGNFDTYLYLIGPGGSVVAENDDGGAGSDSRIPPGSGYYTLPGAGTYVIEATSLRSEITGSYRLSLRLLGRDELVVGAEGFRNAASFQPGIVPGSLVTVFGTNLAPGVRGCVTTATPGGPLPTRLADVEMQFGHHSAPLLSVCNADGNESVTVQAPFELGPGKVPVLVRVGPRSTTVWDVPVLHAQPGIFETAFGQARYGSVMRPDGTAASPQNPVRRGEIARMLVTGLGPVLPLAATNRPGIPGQNVYYQVIVGINKAGVRVISAEYAVNLVGVYTVAFEVPRDAPTGADVALDIAVLVGEVNVPGNGSRIAIAP